MERKELAQFVVLKLFSPMRKQFQTGCDNHWQQIEPEEWEEGGLDS